MIEQEQETVESLLVKNRLLQEMLEDRDQRLKLCYEALRIASETLKSSIGKLVKDPKTGAESPFDGNAVFAIEEALSRGARKPE